MAGARGVQPHELTRTMHRPSLGVGSIYLRRAKYLRINELSEYILLE